jgi:hypothetical protein
MINQIIAISLLVMSAVITADLFIKKDQSLNKTVKNFEITTQNLLKQPKL